MLFIPQAVTAVEMVPMLIYYHGHHGPDSIEGYLAGEKDRDFRSLLKSTKVLLVEPQGGPMSHFRRLGDPAGVSALIFRVMQTAFTLGPPVRSLPKPVPMPPSLILAGFSGGGKALNNVVMGSKEDYISRLTEVWCFDSMYSTEGAKWVEWAKDSDNAKKKLRVRVSTEVANSKGSPSGQADVIRDAIKATPGLIDIADPVKSTHEGLARKLIPGWLTPP
jgi:hypothetical protein